MYTFCTIVVMVIHVFLVTSRKTFHVYIIDMHGIQADVNDPFYSNHDIIYCSFDVW